MDVDAVVFDLGGVIVDLAGLRQFLDRHSLALDEFFARALSSGAHFDFEAGRVDEVTYAEAFLGEVELTDQLSIDQFLAEFVHWPGRLIDGSDQLLHELAANDVVTASLSNTNTIHWNSPYYTSTVRPLFARHFPSYELGLAKPEPAIFHAVTARLEVAPENIVFFDDNRVNVEAAALAGWRGARVDGPAEARAVLVGLGVLGR